MYDKIVIFDECGPNDLNTKNYFGIPIVTPRMSISFAVRRETEEIVRSKLSPGVYRDVTTIKNFLNNVFGYLNQNISVLINELSSRDLLEALHWQYSQTCKVEENVKSDPCHRDANSWQQNRASLRRSLKYIAEKTLESYTNDRHCPFEGYFAKFETLLELVEMSFFFSLLSASTYGVSKERTILEIYEPNNDPLKPYFNLKIENFDQSKFQKGKILFHKFNRKKGSPFTSYIDYFQTESSNVFKELSSGTYDDFWSILAILRDNCAPGDNGVYFIPTQSLKDGIVKEFCIPQKCVELFFKTFSLTQEELKAAPREIFKTKQKNRLKSKFIIQLDWNGVTHSMWTYEIMSEGIAMFLDSPSYNGLPEEWRTPKMLKIFAEITRHFGSEFETYASNHLYNWNIIGQSYKKALPCGIEIPESAGEIDFLGYSCDQKCIVCFEFKNVSYSTDPLEFRDDLDKFIYSKNSYFNKFSKKIEFIKAHIKELVEYYRNQKKIELDSSKFVISFITYAPNISRYYMPKYKCMSISEFEVEWKDNPWQFMIEVGESKKSSK